MHFGPTDGYLSISVGDEGSGEDNPTFNSQRINKDLFAGILRIDGDKTPGTSIEPHAHASIPTDAGIARFSIPKTNPFVLPAAGGNWNGLYLGSAVTGTIWVKHFDMVMNRNPIMAVAPVRKRIETRLIVKTAAGAYGVSYRWNEAATEATLAADGGENFTLNVTLLDNWINAELPRRKTYADWRLEKFGSSSSSEGAPTEDPDGDDADNQSEFLANTLPLDGSSAFRPQLSGSPLHLGFTLPVNRSFLIESSATLGQWTPWDVPGNQGLPVAGDPISLPVPTTDPQRFFRLKLKEN